MWWWWWWLWWWWCRSPRSSSVTPAEPPTATATAARTAATSVPGWASRQWAFRVPCITDGLLCVHPGQQRRRLAVFGARRNGNRGSRHDECVGQLLGQPDVAITGTALAPWSVRRHAHHGRLLPSPRASHGCGLASVSHGTGRLVCVATRTSIAWGTRLHAHEHRQPRSSLHSRGQSWRRSGRAQCPCVIESCWTAGSGERGQASETYACGVLVKHSVARGG